MAAVAACPGQRDEKKQAEERKQTKDGAEEKQCAHVMGAIEKGFSQGSKPGDVPGAIESGGQTERWNCSRCEQSRRAERRGVG